MDWCFFATVIIVSLSVLSCIDSIVENIAKAKVLKSGNKWPEEPKDDDA
jgi:hypothetical protein